MNELIEIGKRIYKLRKEKNMSQEDLAKLVGYKTRSSINKIEKGESSPPQSKIVKIANALETTPKYIMGWDETQINNLTSHEVNLVKAYRAKPGMQLAVDKLLGIDKPNLSDDMKNTIEKVAIPTKQK